MIPNRPKAYFSLLLLSVLCFSNSWAQSGYHVMDHVRGKRYCEILVVSGKITGLTATVYNTLGCNDCPAESWKRIDPGQLRILLGAREVMKNGPRVFVMDKIGQDGITPPRVNLGGIEMIKRATVPLTLTRVLKGKSVPYKENVVNRSAIVVYEKGKRIYELESPLHTYLMLSYSLQVDAHQTEESLEHLAGKLKLPIGWQFRTRILPREMVIKSTEQENTFILQDDLLDSYQRIR
ncbi:MAG: hypothetical protein KGM98_01160 [Bacteroidota bacterium]|nr:hypothetical protein [Bacteroidota bacterium]